jgi:hypothetical protein
MRRGQLPQHYYNQLAQELTTVGRDLKTKGELTESERRMFIEVIKRLRWQAQKAKMKDARLL